MAKQARISEGRNKNADSFDPWFEVSLGIDEFRSKYFERHLSLQWASRMTFGFINKERLVSFVLGVVASIAAYFLTKGGNYPKHIKDTRYFSPTVPGQPKPSSVISATLVGNRSPHFQTCLKTTD